MINWGLVDNVVRAGVERGNGSLGREMNSGVVVGVLRYAIDEIRARIGDVATETAPDVVLGGEHVYVLQLLQVAERRIEDQRRGIGVEVSDEVQRVGELVAVALASHVGMVVVGVVN